MGMIYDDGTAHKFVHELDWTADLVYMYKKCFELFSHLPNVYDQERGGSPYFEEHIKHAHELIDPDKPLLQLVRLGELGPEFQRLRDLFTKYGLVHSMKLFHSNPLSEVFADIEHLFFAHRHHTKSSAAALLFPIQNCNAETTTSWPAHEEVDGYVPTDPARSAIYWSEYYWQTYGKPADHLLTDEEAACRYVLDDKPVLWNVKQFHEAKNRGTSHRIIANINFESATQTWEDTIRIMQEG